jgi:hypothetical protein
LKGIIGSILFDPHKPMAEKRPGILLADRKAAVGSGYI